MPDKSSQHEADFQNLPKLESPGNPSDGSSFTSSKQMHKAFCLVTQWFGLQKNGDFHRFINTSQQIQQLINQLFSKSISTSSISLLRIPAWMPSPLGGRGGGTSSGTPPYVDNGKNWNKILIPSAIRLDGTDFIDNSVLYTPDLQTCVLYCSFPGLVAPSSAAACSAVSLYRNHYSLQEKSFQRGCIQMQKSTQYLMKLHRSITSNWNFAKQQQLLAFLFERIGMPHRYNKVCQTRTGQLTSRSHS